MQRSRILILCLLVALPCLAAQRGPAVAALRTDGTSEIVPSPIDGSRVRVIVEFTTPPLSRTPAGIRSLARQAPLFVRFREDLQRIAPPSAVTHEYSRAFSGVALSIASSQRAALEKLPYVRRVHPDLPVKATALLEPGVAKIRANEVWSGLDTQGAGITVAILDTGVDYAHPALGGGFGPGFKVAGGYDFVHGDADPMDDSGHGTHVAGIVAANAPNLTGVAPEASLLAYKVLDSIGTGWGSDIIAGIERTVDPNQDGDLSDHADVANMSLGGPGYSDDAMSLAVDGAVAAGVVFVVAAGNEQRFQSISSPGTAESAITVGATDANDALASFTSKGPPAARYGIKPDVVAPGVDVRSAKLGGGTLAASGTSMAAPHVAGAAALLLALHPDWTPADVRSALVTTAAPHAAEVMAAGAGRIDVYRAATLKTRVLPAQVAFGVIDGKAPSWTGTRSVIVTNRGTAPRTYELVPGSARDGIAVEVNPATLTLGPGESAGVVVKVTVDNAKVPYPTAGSLSYSGFLEARSANEVLRIPWAFVKAARLRVRYADDDAYSVVFIGGHSATSRIVWPIGWNLFENLVTPASYNVLLVSFAEVEPRRETAMILRDVMAIDGDQQLELSPADAPYRLTFNAADEAGNSIRAGESEAIQCLPFRFLMFRTQAWGYQGIDLLYSTGTLRLVTSYPPDIRTSAITDRYSLFGGEVCANAGLSRLYALDYAEIHGVTGDVTRQAGGTELQGRETTLRFGPTSDRRMLMLGGRFALYAGTGGYAPTFIWDPWPTDEWKGTVFVAPSRDPDMALRPLIEAQTDSVLITAHPLRVVDGGVASFSSWYPSPTTYVASPSDPIDFGLGPVLPKLAFTSVGNGADVELQLAGPLDERILPLDSIRFRTFDRSGHLLAEDSAPLRIGNLSRPIVLEAEASGARVEARLGGTQADQLPPALTSLAVLNALSQPKDRIGRGTPARLRFSAIDAPSTPVKREATKVWTRATGTTQWHPLPVAIREEDFGNPEYSGHDPQGTIYECSLASLTEQEGSYDLRIAVEDASANTLETTWEGAFEVVPNVPVPPRRPRGRAVRH